MEEEIQQIKQHLNKGNELLQFASILLEGMRPDRNGDPMLGVSRAEAYRALEEAFDRAVTEWAKANGNFKRLNTELVQP